MEEAVPHARASTTVRPGERIALLWELYGVGEGTPLEIEISLTKPGKSFFRRAAEWLGLAKESDPSVSLEWREDSLGGPAGSPRYLELEIPELSNGRYALSASVRAGGAGVSSVRVLRVADR